MAKRCCSHLVGCDRVPIGTISNTAKMRTASIRALHAIAFWLAIATQASSSEEAPQTKPAALAPQTIKSPFKSPVPAEKRIVLAAAADDPKSPDAGGQSYESDAGESAQNI